MTKKPIIHTTGREGWEDSEERYYDGIGLPNQADRMICQAEEGQVLPAGTTYELDEWLEEIDREVEQVNLPTRVAEPATAGRR